MLFARLDEHGRDAGGATTRASGRAATRRSWPASPRRCAVPNRQYAQIAADLGYAPPSFNAFDRVTDADTPHRSYQDLGGASLTLDQGIGGGLLTSITAWRYWNWDPSNDRDFIGLPVTSISANPSEQRQWTQEVRYTADLSPDLGLVLGAFGFRQTHQLDGPSRNRARRPPASCWRPARSRPRRACSTGTGRRRTSARRASARRCSASSNGRSPIAGACSLACASTTTGRTSTTMRDVYGGLQTTDPALVALQRSILAPQTYAADVDDTNVSGQLTTAYRIGGRGPRVRDIRDELQVRRPQPRRRSRPTRWAGRPWPRPRSSPRTNATWRSA